MSDTKKAELLKAVLLLRYRTTQPNSSSHKFLSYKNISDTLNLNYHVVQHLCRNSLLKQQLISPEKQVRVLEQVHIDYLLSQRTLEMYSGLTMKQRTIRFHRVYTNKRIAVTTLRRLYLKNGIKRKKIRQEKPKPNLMRPNHLQECQTALNELREAKAEERVIIYLDELNFTKRSLLTREWSSKNSNLSVDQEEVYVGYRSVIASMTETKGIDHLQLHMEAINADNFIVYLKALLANNASALLLCSWIG